PLTRKRLSYDGAPEMVIWLFGPLLFTPGARRTVSRTLRRTGSSEICFWEKFRDISVVSSTAGADAVTVMASVTPETFSSASTCAGCARVSCVHLMILL